MNKTEISTEIKKSIHSFLLIATNIIKTISPVVFSLSFYLFFVILGFHFNPQLAQSPLLKILGFPISFVILLLSGMVGFLTYFISGYSELYKNIFSLLPVGTTVFNITLGSMVISLFLLRILLYIKKHVESYVSDGLLNFINLLNISAFAFLSFFFIKALKTYLSLLYLIPFCVSGIFYCFFALCEWSKTNVEQDLSAQSEDDSFQDDTENL